MTQHSNTVIHADCTQFLPQLPAGIASFVLTDPPYQRLCMSIDFFESGSD
jgi:DNA modification methylase